MGFDLLCKVLSLGDNINGRVNEGSDGCVMMMSPRGQASGLTCRKYDQHINRMRHYGTGLLGIQQDQQLSL